MHMRTRIRIILAAGLVLGAVWQVRPAHAQHAAGLNTVLTFQIGGGTKTLDLGTNGSGQTPPNWASVGYDDSGWVPAATASVSCTTGDWTQDYQAIGSPPIFWGANPADAYLFRQDFGLPAAKSYFGSSVNISILAAVAFDAPIFVNGTKVDTLSAFLGRRYMSQQYAIGAYLKPGSNVLAVAAPTGGVLGDSEYCGALSFTITARMTDIQPTPPTPVVRPLTTILPGQHAVLSGSHTLPYSWNRYPGASYYYLQFWLVSPAQGQQITARSVTTFTVRLSGTSYNLDTSHMLKGTYVWRMAAVSLHGKLLSPWTAEQSVTLK